MNIFSMQKFKIRLLKRIQKLILIKIILKYKIIWKKRSKLTKNKVIIKEAFFKI